MGWGRMEKEEERGVEGKRKEERACGRRKRDGGRKKMK